ncbi:MAG: hypothetical protein ACRD1H_19460, partial [Vicinamibacterales bacterium]
SHDFAARRGLNGSAYIERVAPGEQAAIDWLVQHADPGDAVVEAPGCSYVNVAGVPTSRLSAFSGVPTLVGWWGHEWQWRRGRDDIQIVLDDRTARANAILDGAVSVSDVDARFVVLGVVEASGNAVCDKAPELGADAEASLAAAGWMPAFEADGTTILVRPNDPLVAQSD